MLQKCSRARRKNVASDILYSGNVNEKCKLNRMVKTNMKSTNEYVTPIEAWELLKKAKITNQPVYIFGITGYGKTELVKRFMEKKKYYYFNISDDIILDLSDIPASNPGKLPMPVVIDNVSRARDEETRAKILELGRREDIWLIMIGKSAHNLWMAELYLERGMTIISEEKLRFSLSDTDKYFRDRKIELRSDEIKSIWDACQGNPYYLNLIAEKINQGIKYSDKFLQDSMNSMDAYIETMIFSQWDKDVLNFLMQISVVDSFNNELAEFITGNHYIAEILDRIMETSYIIFVEEGTYRIRKILLRIMRKRADSFYGSAKIKDLCYNAGLYYELHGCISEALEMYVKSDNRGRIGDLLIRNSLMDPGTGQYYELRKYYLALTDEEIEKSIELMAAESMMYALLMQFDKSEYWKCKLQEYAAKATGQDKKEASTYVAYLEIALPQTDSASNIELLSNWMNLALNKNITLPQMSITSNMPSIINGGKDCCEPAKNEKEAEVIYAKFAKALFGRHEKGFINIVMGEIAYEKAQDSLVILSRENRGMMEAEAGGTMQIIFVSIGVQVRLNLILGNYEAAVEMLENFRDRAKQEAPELLPNIDAMLCRLRLRINDKDLVNAWLEEASDENEFFCMDRYIYFTKARAYLNNREYTKAYAVLEKLKYYGEQLNRSYVLAECALLTAITMERVGRDEWKQELIKALEIAGQYGFIRIISEEGAAVLPLLEAIQKDIKGNDNIDRSWYLRLVKDTREISLRYPNYLKVDVLSKPDFSNNALEILRYQADGYSTKEISEKMNMKHETVRYHIKQNYKKLGVTGKTDAVLAARDLQLL